MGLTLFQNLLFSSKGFVNLYKMLTNKSPLRYPGGKTRACKILDEIVNQNFNMKEKKQLLEEHFSL